MDKKLEKKLANLLIESEPDDFFEYERMALGDELNSEQEELLKKDPIKFEAFKPFDQDFKNKLANLAQARLESGAAAEPTKEKKQGFFSTYFKNKDGGLSLSGWSLVSAAVIALFIFLPFGTKQPLPDYSLEFKGGDHMIRGSEDANKQMIEHPSFSTGSKLAFILRPKSEIVKDLKIKVFAFSAGNIKALNLKVQSDIDGNIRIFGNLGTDFSLNSGKWTIAILLGPEKSISNQEKLIKYLTPGKKAGKDEDIIWFKRTVLINNAK